MKSKNTNNVLTTKCEKCLTELSEKDASAISGGLFAWGGDIFAGRRIIGYSPSGTPYYG